MALIYRIHVIFSQYMKRKQKQINSICILDYSWNHLRPDSQKLGSVSNRLMTMASWGWSVMDWRVTGPKRSRPVLVTNIPLSGRLKVHLESRAWGSEPKLNSTRKWKHPHERRKAVGGVAVGFVEPNKSDVELKVRKVMVPRRRASSWEHMRLRACKRAVECFRWCRSWKKPYNYSINLTKLGAVASKVCANSKLGANSKLIHFPFEGKWHPVRDKKKK